MQANTVLFAEDDPLQRRMIEAMLQKKLHYHIVSVENGQQAIEKIEQSSADMFCAVLLDVHMPVMDGLTALTKIRELRPDLPIVMLTSDADISSAVKAVRLGATDYLTKPVDSNHLEVAFKNAARISGLAREISILKRKQEGALSFADIIGYDKGLQATINFARKASLSDVPVLISGETGVGKELFARAIHGESKRMGKPFVAVNCGAIPENLVESSLFGHEKGSFTGAIASTLGKFREAEGGTLFLDEIGELPLETQVKLLRALQQKEIEPVGASKPIKVNVRIISATHRDLRAETRAGRFREDLYFRLNVLPITVPPLRERKEDIIPLARYFIERIVHTNLLPMKTLGKSALHYLEHYPWPGNVRELENLLHRVLVLSDADIIEEKQLLELQEHDLAQPDLTVMSEHGTAIALLKADGRFKTMTEIEQEVMQKALTYYEGNVTKAAAELAIAKSTFYRKMKETIGDA